VLRAYGIAASRPDSRTLVHQVATYLIDPQGRIARRYLGLEHPQAEVRADLEAACG
jgi:cytochrome oxidase Cu insertion factor (SCO1/SenC/PrrC family)